MIHINNSIHIEDAEIGETYILHSQGRMNGVNFENIILIDDSDGVEIEEAKWRGIRRKRNELLTDSDKHIFYDFPQTPEQENKWVEYRQQLRDVTEQDINNFVWPTPPY